MDFVISATNGCHAVGAGRGIKPYSMNTGSYVYHMTGNHGQYNEHFNNNFFSVERKFSQDSKYSVLVGTMKNSFDDRCLTLGVRRDWLKNDTGWVLKGVYAYTGEFFFDAFSHWGFRHLPHRQNHRHRFFALPLSWPAI
jgi:hypothetical protein